MYSCRSCAVTERAVLDDENAEPLSRYVQGIFPYHTIWSLIAKIRQLGRGVFPDVLTAELKDLALVA